MTIFLSFFPILLTILALGLRMKALHAALLGVVATIMAIALAFPLSLSQIGAASLRWGPILTEVIAIIAGGLLLSNVLQHNRGQAALAKWIEERSGNNIGTILLIVHGITPFAESVTGFGIGITIAIPLLVHLGLSASRVAVIGLMGLCAVPWGSMGPGTLIAATMADVSFYKLGIVSAVISFIPFTLTGMAAALLSGSAEHRRRDVFYGFLSGLCLCLLISVMNLVVGTAPAGALAALIMIVFYLMLGGKRQVPHLNREGRNALYSYAVLLSGVLLTSWIVGLLKLPAGWHYLASPAVWLFVASLFAAKGLPQRSPVRKAWDSWVQSASVTGLFLVIGILMSISGMAECLARTLAQAGPGYAVMAPLVAALGGFVTGSNSGANAMFAATQADIARSLHFSVLWFMGIHNVAASFLLMASPSKIEMALQLIPGATGTDRHWIQKMVLYVSIFVVLALMLLSCLFLLSAC
ncbi:L-lactate permease [Bombella sp. TMW 2.2543]|uniref:L-lactate permease n=1 Tax=Bombella pluederhausensis TaxID=2967336 RepID=A0ABT3WM26_9PROT|nr:L-lactate permease [Bombella pluederhausensis]MCX5617876.1 L-lactate permease [Bombella pluederhausensis]